MHQERNVEDFTGKVLKLFADETLRTELGENGKYFVRNEFSWEQTSKKLIHLYDTLLT